MKSLVPWICFFMASASQNLYAEDEFGAYRLGNYGKAAEPLMSKSGQDPVADYYLARLYLYGYGQLKNTNLAMRYFMKSAEKGYLPAVQFMAEYELMKNKNPTEAVRWFKQAAQAGDINAQMFMAAAYLFGVGVQKNVDVASKYYIDAAKNGNPIAQFAVAENFLGSRHSSNAKLGLIWLTKSANNGNLPALTKLGTLYLNGQFLTKDEVRGKELLQTALDKNYAPAMIALGDFALSQNNPDEAIKYYQEAINQKNVDAYLHMAHVYLQDKSPQYNANEGFTWTLKAAELGSTEAKKELAGLYLKGIGVASDEALAKKWSDQALLDEKKQIDPLAKAALWLSNNTTNQLDKTSYQVAGIDAWQNPAALVNNNYNQAPQIQVLSKKAMFQPQFELTQPNDVPINSYYDALVSRHIEYQSNQWTYPSYPLNPLVASLERVYSKVLMHEHLPAPYIDANYYPDDDFEQASIMDIWMPEWQKYVNYKLVFNHLYFRAILGDAQSQFEIGQMFQYGLGVTPNDESAIVFYQNAADQKHLGGEYNLGILYLQRASDEAGYQTALNWLTDGAFKGNKKSQYVLSRLLDKSKQYGNEQQFIKPNDEQALSMLYLSASNHYGPAQYELAEHLVREVNNGLNVDVKKHKIALIRQLYEGAAKNKVAQALLPLAFYDAMENNKASQDRAYLVAKEQADAGDETAALLLGMLYDRGIGVGRDPAKAIYWYEKSGQNPVSQFILGTYVIQGQGLDEDKDKGLSLLQQAADSQFSYADFNLAILKHQKGLGFIPELKTAYDLGNHDAGIVLADYYVSRSNRGIANTDELNQAKEIYTHLAEKGDQYAQLKLGYMMDKGIGIARDPNESLRWYTAAADQGNAMAQFQLGQFYQLGALGQPDYALAKQWYQKASEELAQAWVALGFIDETVDDNYPEAMKAYQAAADKGDVWGTYNLALMYEYGKGVPVDYAKARALYDIAAAKGIDEAMTQIAGMYFYGLGQEKNEQEAYSWYQKAAALGNSNALYALGLLSEAGVVTKLDYSNAINYYSQSANKGNEKALLALARLYHYGIGVAKDPKKSEEIYQKLAKMQNAYAQYQLATYYLEGISGERSPEKGMELLRQARDNGSPQARRALERLEVNTQQKLSFVEPVILNNAPSIQGQPVEWVYLQAMNEWNRGNEVLSRMMIQQLVTQYPHFLPAKQFYQRFNEAKKATTFG